MCWIILKLVYIVVLIQKYTLNLMLSVFGIVPHCMQFLKAIFCSENCFKAFYLEILPKTQDKYLFFCCNVKFILEYKLLTKVIHLS